MLFFVLCVLGVYLAFYRCAFSTTYHIGVIVILAKFLLFFVISGVIAEADTSSFQRQWIYVSETSAVIYIRGRAATIAPDRLADTTQDWEADRWQNYFVKYAPNLPPIPIIGNNSTTLFAAFKSKTPSEYIIYMKWEYVPATPLNIACYEPNAMNEVYSNTFVALTEYRQTRHEGYGDSGQWASSIYFVGMNRGPSQTGAYSSFIHDNQFISNDLFASADQPVNMTIRIERNRFTLPAAPLPTTGRMAFRNIGVLG